MIRIVIKNWDETEQLLRETILEKLPPVEIDISCPYAKYVEFGSDPARSTSPTNSVYDPICKDFVTETRYKIRNWTQTRLSLDDKERKSVGDKIYRSIMDKGTIPRPFIRPTIHKAVGMLENKDLGPMMINSQKSISENIAMWMEIEMKRILKERGYDQDIPIAGGRLLIDSIRVNRLRTSAIRVKHAEANTISEAAWKSDTSDRHGANKGR